MQNSRFMRGGQAALQYLTGYIVEESLSVDNLFVIALIFTYFRVPIDVYQISYVPFKLLPLDAATVIVGAILICFLATIHPARGASRLDPAEALRYE